MIACVSILINKKMKIASLILSVVFSIYFLNTFLFKYIGDFNNSWYLSAMLKNIIFIAGSLMYALIFARQKKDLLANL